MWPIITTIPAICTNNALSEFFAIAPTNIANNIATIPFAASPSNVKSAALFPTERNTFVAPAFPLPFSLTSNPAILLLINTEKLILPNKYATTATIIYVAISIIPFFHLILALKSIISRFFLLLLFLQVFLLIRILF